MNHQLLHDASEATAYRLLEKVGGKLSDEEWQQTFAAVYAMVYTGLETALELYRVRHLEPSRN